MLSKRNMIKNKKIVAIIQARLGSKRLPGKALKKISGKTLIEWIKYRLGFCLQIDQIVLSTADTKENDVLVQLAEKIGLEYYRGSENNLINRIYHTAKKFSADAVVRITGDCPLVDPSLVDKMVRIFKEKYPKIDYVTNVFPPTFPDGLDIEVFSTRILKTLNARIKKPLYREVFNFYMLENKDHYKIFNLKNKSDLSSIRLTVDYAEDFLLIKKIIDKLGRGGRIFYQNDIIRFLKNNPKIAHINEKWNDTLVIRGLRNKEYHQKIKNKKV